jgi:hypothetical protein
MRKILILVTITIAGMYSHIAQFPDVIFEAKNGL